MGRLSQVFNEHQADGKVTASRGPNAADDTGRLGARKMKQQ